MVSDRLIGGIRQRASDPALFPGFRRDEIRIDGEFHPRNTWAMGIFAPFLFRQPALARLPGS
jgi:hypothetical protein